MSAQHRSVVRTLIDEEIRRIVADAIGSLSIVRSSRLAEQIARAYANSGVDIDEIEAALNGAAIKAGVPLELGKPNGA